MSKKKLVSVAVASLLALGGSLGLATGASAAATTATTARISGADRYETAVKVALVKAAANDLKAVAGTVYVASGEVFADALAAGPLAARDNNVLLLVEQNKIPASVTAALSTRKDYDIVVIGGTGSISSAVFEQLGAYTRDSGGSILRIAGVDRYETATKIAANDDFNSTPADSKYYIASGEVAWDALSASPLAAKADAPILLTQGGSLPAVTAAFLKAEEATDGLSIDELNIVGGTGSVGTAVVNALSAIEGVTLSGATIEAARISGADRYATSAAVAAKLGGTVSPVYVASGTVYPDALAGAQVAGSTKPILLVGSSLSSAVATQLSARSAATVVVTALGGAGSVSDATLAAAVTAAKTAAPSITWLPSGTAYVATGATFNPLSLVTATDSVDGNITSKVTISKYEVKNALGAFVETTGFSTAAAAEYRLSFKVVNAGGIEGTLADKLVTVANAPKITFGPLAATEIAASTSNTLATLNLVDHVVVSKSAGTVVNTAAALAPGTTGGDATTGLMTGLAISVKQTTGTFPPGGAINVSPASTAGQVTLASAAAVGTITVTYTFTDTNGLKVSVDRVITTK